MRASRPLPRSVILGIALGAALVAACGGATSPSAAPSAAASPVGSAAAAGSTGPATPRPAGAYSLTLPKGWRALQIGSNYAATAATYNDVNLRFATSLASQLLSLPKTASAYAFDASDATVGSGTLVGLTVTEVVLPVTVNLDAFSAEVGRQASLVAETDVPAERIQTVSGPADRFVYAATFGASSAVTTVAAVTQVVLVAPGRGYVLTFATTPARAAVDAPVFDAIAHSIVLAP